MSHSERAALIHAKIREIIPLIEGFEFAPPKGLGGLAVGTCTVPLPFIEVNAAALEELPELTIVAGGPQLAVELRSESAYLAALEPVCQALHRLARGCQYTLAYRRQRVGRKALRVYDYAKALNRAGEKAGLVPHVEAMSRALGRSRAARMAKLGGAA